LPPTAGLPWFDDATCRRRFLPERAAHGGTLALILGMSLLLNLGGLVVPWITQRILDRVAPSGDLPWFVRCGLARVTAFQIALTLAGTIQQSRQRIGYYLPQPYLSRAGSGVNKLSC
jgi:ABC-type bacteriocin/lantibiotic exporter with double-glycine peptidase domain